MKKKLIFGFMMISLGYAASQVLSQSPPVRQRAAEVSEPPRQRTPEVVGRQPGAAGFRESFNDEIQRLRDKLAENPDPQPRDAALLKALDKYIASDKLSKIIMDLEAFAKQAPETDEAKKAIEAVQLLKAEPRTALSPTPDSRTFESAPVYEPVRPRNRQGNSESPFETER